MSINLIFFGSSEYSLPVLDKLIHHQLTSNDIQLRYVVTSPDKPVGRHLKLTPNPVKVLAQKYQIHVIESLKKLPENFIDSHNQTLGLVAAFGQIIPQNILSIFNNQIYNIHPSMLPKYRGPSPLQQQILDGEKDTGVTVIQLDAQMDHGPVVAQKKDFILDTDTPPILGKRLFEKGTDLFLDLLQNNSLPKSIHPVAQDDSQSTYTRKLTRQDGFVPYPELKSQLAAKSPLLDSKFRAYWPWPGLWTINPEGKRLKLLSLTPLKFS